MVNATTTQTEPAAVQQSAGTTPLFVDKRGLAAALGLCTRTIANLQAKGLPHLRIGARRVRFDVADVSRWLKSEFGVSRRR